MEIQNLENDLYIETGPSPPLAVPTDTDCAFPAHTQPSTRRDHKMSFREVVNSQIVMVHTMADMQYIACLLFLLWPRW